MLLGKLIKAMRALEDLRRYSIKAGDAALFSDDARRVVDKCLEQLKGIRTFPYSPLAIPGCDFRNPAGLGMVKLYWFFRHACGISGDESEVRVALIRNAFWKKYGISEVPYRRKYQDAESKGCGAVHEAVSRYRFPQGTTPQQTT